MDKFLLGIDIGTSACKTALFEKDGTVLAQAAGAYPVYYPKSGWAEQNPEEWWEQICISVKQVISKAGISPEQIGGIGIDGQSWSCIPVDQNGNCLYHTPIWMDTRARELAAETEQKVGREKIFEVSGNPFSPSYTTPKITWFQQEHPDIYRNTYKFMQSNSYIAMKLTGVFSQELSQGYGLHFFEASTCTYHEEMAELLGIDLDKIPELYDCSQIIGEVTRAAADACGLVPGIPVAAGGLDAACGTLGAGVYRPGQTQEQGGQAGGMSICEDQAVGHPNLILGAHVVPGCWLLQGGTVGGGGVLKWFQQEFGKGNSFDDLTREAAAVEAGADGVIFLPYMAGERSPIWQPDAKGVFYGLGFDKTRGHMIRAALEGVAFALEHNLRTAAETGVAVNELSAMGGAANSLLWTQIKADVTGKTIKVPASDTATTLGAALLAGVGTGMYAGFEDAAAQTIRITREHQPDMKKHEKYCAQMEQYLKLSQTLSSTFWE